MKIGLVTAATVLLVGACTRDAKLARTDTTDAATAALPAPGSTLPPFAYPVVRGSLLVNSDSLRGHPTVIALWSWHSPTQEAAMQDFDSLMIHTHGSGVRFVVLADHRQDPVLDTLLSQPWASRADAVAAAYQKLGVIFDQSGRAAQSNPRATFQLPSFLLVDGDGRVLRRAFGSPTQFRKAIDSLARVNATQIASADSALAAKLQPRLAEALLTFDPGTLQSTDSVFSIGAGCDDESQSDVGILPALGRILDLNVTGTHLYATVEFLSVARVEAPEGEELCITSKRRLVSQLGVDTLKVHLLTYATDPDTARWVSVEPYPSASASGGRYGLVGLSSNVRGSLAAPPGSPVRALRARIDSIRRAQLR